MIRTKKLRCLNLSKPTSRGRIAAITAASGLVNVHEYLYVVADDELHLGVFHLEGKAPGTTIRLFPGRLPHSKKSRKKRKPDLEILVHLPANWFLPHGALLAIPSGSKQNRHRGALLPLSADGSIKKKPETLDLQNVFTCIEAKIPDFNLEGAVIRGNSLWIIHRGHQDNPNNHIVKIPLKDFLRAARAGKKLPSTQIRSVSRFKIPAPKGMHYTITDVAPMDEKSVIFVAVAEAAKDSYADGRHFGSVLGVLNNKGKVVFIDKVSPRKKMEGVCVVKYSDKERVLLVNDEDNPKTSSELRYMNLKSLPS
jgi:hypothetical protein